MSKRRKKTERQPGISFEEAVTAVQKLLDPSAVVLHDQRLVDRLGHRRQFDVVIRTKAAGHEVLGVIECKDLGRRVGSPEINAFADKARNVNANVVLMVSRQGFTKPALELAKFNGIGTFSLLKQDHAEKGVTFGAYWHAMIFSWNLAQVTLHLEGAVPVSSFAAENVLIDAKPLVPWILNRLYTVHNDVRVPGWHRLEVAFVTPTAAIVETKDVRLMGVQVDAERVCEYRRKRIVWAGRAFYDWSERRIIIPANEPLVTDPWRSDFSDWDKVDGPPLAEKAIGFIEARFVLVHGPNPLWESGLRLEEMATVTFLPRP